MEGRYEAVAEWPSLRNEVAKLLLRPRCEL